MIESKDFRPELFIDPKEYEETPLRDRKQEFHNLRRDDKKTEFIRDVIALSNTAQWFAKPAYLLFGLDNEGEVRSIESDLSSYEAECSNELQIGEKVRQHISQIIHRYVTPPLVEWDIKFGSKEGNQVAYLMIGPPVLATHPLHHSVRGFLGLLCRSKSALRRSHRIARPNAGSRRATIDSVIGYTSPPSPWARRMCLITSSTAFLPSAFKSFERRAIRCTPAWRSAAASSKSCSNASVSGRLEEK